MKQINPEDVPEYLNKDISSSVQHENDEQGKYFDEMTYEPVGMLNNTPWVMATSSNKGENKVIDSQSEYGKLQLPFEFGQFIKTVATSNNSTESEVVKVGLTLLKLARKVKSQGLNLAITDSDGKIISNIEL